MKNLIVKITVFCFVATFITSCTQNEDKICNDFLRGEWYDEDWSGMGESSGIYDSERKSFVNLDVPANPWGFHNGEETIIEIEPVSSYSFECMAKIRFSNGDIEWTNATIIVEDDNTITVDTNCPNCVEEVHTLKRR